MVFLMLLVLGCTQEEKIASDFWIKYDQSNWTNIKKEKVLDSLYRHFAKQSNDSLNRNDLFRVAARYERLNLNDKYYKTVDFVRKWAVEKKDTLDLAKAFWYKGDYQDALQAHDSAFHYYSRAEKLYRLSKKDSLNWGRMYLYKAGSLYDIGIYTESEVEAVKAMEIFSNLSTTWFPYQTKLQMALILSGLKEYEEALKYYYLALNHLKIIKNEPEEVAYSHIICYNNLGSHYNKMENYSQAKNYLEKGLDYKKIKKVPDLHAMLLNNYAYSKMQLGENQKVDSLLSLSLHLRDSIGHKQGIIASKLNIGEYFLLQKDTLQATENIQDAYLLAMENNSHLDIQRSLKFLAENDILNKEFYTNRYLTVKDSIREIERATRDKFARIAYETEQISLENEVLIKRNTILLFLFAGAISFIIITIIAYRFMLKNRELKYKQKEQQSTEEIYELLLKENRMKEEIRTKERDRIAMELHDGIVNRIFTTRLNLELLDSNNEKLKDKLLKELRNTEKHIRDVSHDLHNKLFFENQDFNKLLQDLVTNQKNAFHTKFTISIDRFIPWSEVSTKQKVHIYRILQEALNNVNKYAKAPKCFVVLLKRDLKIIFRIHDNGIGFNPKKKKKGLGFKIFEERAKELKGVLIIKSEKRMGTIVEVSFPRSI